MRVNIRKKWIFLLLLISICGFPLFSWGDSSDDDDDSYDSSWDWSDDDDDSDCFDWSDVFDDSDSDDGFDDSWSGDDLDNGDNYQGNPDEHFDYEDDFDFGDGKKDDDSDSLESLISHYEEAKAELAAVLEGEKTADPIEYGQLQEAMESAKDALDAYCAAHDYTYAEDAYSGAVSVYNADGQIVNFIGDPVMLASGIFRLEDSDISIQAGKTVFSVTRRYESFDYDEEKSSDGAFGSLWTSLLDSRIILGFYEAYAVEAEKWQQLVDSAQSLLESVQSYAEEDPECEEFVLQAEEILAERTAKRDEMQALASLSAARAEKNACTGYGYPARMAGSLGLKRLIFVDDHGNPHVFEESDGLYKSDSSGDRLTLSYNADEDSYQLFYKTGEERVYDGKGLLQTISFPDGGLIAFSYNENHRIAQVCVNGMRSLSFSWDGPHVKSVSEGMKTISYGYEGMRLLSVQDEEGDVKSYAYDENNRLTRQIKCDGSYIGIGYATGPDGKTRTACTINENGAKEEFIYDPASRRTTYIDHDGVQSLYEYDSQNRTVRESYADGKIVSSAYDGEGRLAWREVNGNRESYSYDADGHLLSVHFSDGSSIRQTYSGDKLISYSDRDGVTTSFEYDSRGNNTAVWRGGSKVWSYKYNALNLITEAGDSYGNRIEFSYDGRGNLAQKKIFTPASSAALSSESWLYDTRNRLIQHTFPSGIVQTFRYENHAVFCSQSNGFETEMRYSNRKDLVYVGQKDTVTGEERIYRYEYDKCHRIIRTFLSGTDGRGRKQPEVLIQSKSYTGEGRLLQNIVWDNPENGNPGSGNPGDGWAVQSEYSGAGTVVRMKYGMAGSRGDFTTFSHALNYQTRYTADGLEMTESNDDGRSILRRYDFWDRLLEVRSGNILRQQRGYSPAGRLLETLTPYGGKMAFEYDRNSGHFASSREIDGSLGREETFCYPDGKKSLSISALGAKTYYEYDVHGNLTRLLSEGKIETWTYDAASRLKNHSIFAPDGRLVAEEALVYSADDRSLIYTKGGRCKKVFRMNAFGQVISIQDADGNTEHFVYDVRGRCVEAYDVYGKKTVFTYNGKNQLIQTVSCMGVVTTREYDFDGNCIKISDSSGSIYEAVFDRSGRLVSKRENPSPVTERYVYDEKDRIIKILRGDKKVFSTEYAEDDRSFTRIDAKGGRQIYQTDTFGRILSEKNRLGAEQTFHYRADASLSLSRDFGGGESAFSYVRAENKTTARHSDGSYTEEIRDAAGNIIYVRNESSHLHFTYDTAGLMLSQEDLISGEIVTFTYDECGRRTRLQSPKQDVTWHYGKRGEVTEVSDRISGLGMKFVYDDMGNEILRLHSTGESLQSFYDESGRLLLSAAFSALSNLISAEGAVYGSHGEKLLSLNSDLTLTRYRYDEDGRLCSVQYPWSEELAGYLKELCDECGAAVSRSSDTASAIISLSPEEYKAVKNLCSQLGAGFYQPRINEAMLEEKFFYDANGNLSRRETPFGTIVYEYDAEDRLLSWGNAGSALYDANGNLIYKKNLFKCENYIYTKNNRMKSVAVQDLASSESQTVTCRYDALGRRTEISSSLSGRLTTTYDGLSFRDLYAVRGELPQDEENEIKGMRYQFIDDESAGGRTRSPSLPSGDSRSYSASRAFSPLPSYTGYTLLYGNMSTPAALSMLGTDSAERYSLFSDAAGSVKACGKNDGSQNIFSYDAFGAPLSASGTTAAARIYGFAGKKSLDITSLYDFGYRDYSPSATRFTTSDPVRDGLNWYTYCGGDPVNWVDRLGLEMELVVDKGSHTNHSGQYGDKEDTRDTCVMGVYQDGVLIMEVEVTVAVVSHNSSLSYDASRTQVSGSGLTHPTQFPDGTYNVTAVTSNRSGNNNFEGAWLRTDATQYLDDIKNGGKVLDGGYCVHYTAYSMTNGCVGVQSKEQMDALVWAVIQNEKNDPHSTRITVMDSSKMATATIGNKNN